MKKLETEIKINTSVAKVWEILTDFEQYSWNPFIKEVKGDIEVGKNIHVLIQPKDKSEMKFDPVVLTYRKEQEFRWKGKLFVDGLFDGEHYFILKAINTNTTRLIHGEIFTGLLSSILFSMIGKSTEEGFVEMNQALKHKCEAETIINPA